MKWLANCRGVDEHGTPLVAVYGSEQMDAVDRSRMVAAAPELLGELKLAIRYLEHPDVRPIIKNMALSGEAVIERCNSAIARAERME
uniref:Uncharacterized protein n=1 Tax=viral metagenome TaxID=1070528 RepID=A0A6H1ZFM6_9ZZZZ